MRKHPLKIYKNKAGSETGRMICLRIQGKCASVWSIISMSKLNYTTLLQIDYWLKVHKRMNILHFLKAYLIDIITDKSVSNGFLRLQCPWFKANHTNNSLVCNGQEVNDEWANLPIHVICLLASSLRASKI